MRKLAALAIGGALCITSTLVSADVASQLQQYVGYTIVAVLDIVGYQDSNGKHGDSFEGCEYGRVIIFEGNKALTCTGYGYHYGYRPKALVLSRGGSFKMIVDSDVYDMHN